MGEDGRGTHRLPLGSDCLLLADTLVHRMLVDQSQSTPHTSRNNTHSNRNNTHSNTHSNGAAAARDNSKGITTRGANYFVHSLRLHRLFQQEDGAVNDKGRERAQTALAVALMNMLPCPTPAPAAAVSAVKRSGGGGAGGGDNTMGGGGGGGPKGKGLQVAVVVPDVASWQRLQLLLGTTPSSCSCSLL